MAHQQHDHDDVKIVSPTSEDVDDRLQFLHYSKNAVHKAIKQPIKTSTTEIKPTEKKSNVDSFIPSSSPSVFAETTGDVQNISPRIQQRSDFFSTIRKRYQLDSLNEDNILQSKTKLCDTVTSKHVKDEETALIANTLRSRNRRLNKLRKVDPFKMDIGTRIQYIRLELFEMREQDKMLYLQLMKLQVAMQEVRSFLKNVEDNPEEDYVFGPICDWPRSTSSSEILDYLSTDGAKEFKESQRGLKRDLSLQYRSTSAYMRRRFQSSLRQVDTTN